MPVMVARRDVLSSTPVAASAKINTSTREGPMTELMTRLGDYKVCRKQRKLACFTRGGEGYMGDVAPCICINARHDRASKRCQVPEAVYTPHPFGWKNPGGPVGIRSGVSAILLFKPE